MMEGSVFMFFLCDFSGRAFCRNHMIEVRVAK